MKTNNIFLKVDNNRIINEATIRWVQKMNECLEVCTKQDGCITSVHTHKICKVNSPESYHKLNKHFEE